ncbi:MAG TPA: alpha/beta fold hydrolase [Myxococcaceae bacterium]|nr:alpha/beta fold hydrolase [Myxococcaceae bacterium]
MTRARSSAAASPRLLDLRLPPLTLLGGARVDPHHARLQWWGPEADLPVLERLGAEVPPESDGPVLRRSPVRARDGASLDASIPTVLVIHALTGDARAAGPDGWWAPLIGPGRPLDPARVRVLCANNLGSCYGSSGPLDEGWPLNGTRLTPWDQARALWAVLDLLGVPRLRLATGASLGGMIALCLPVLRPGAVDRLLPIGTSIASSAWVTGWNHVARQVLRLDPGWPSDVGRGLELARQLAMLTYRAEPSLDARQHRRAGHPPEAPWALPIQSYLEHQGRKLRRRFDARAYLLQLEAMDAHDLDCPPPGVPARPLGGSAICVDVDTDQLFTPVQVDLLADWLTAHGTEARRATVRSPHGHDAFLIEWEALDPLLRLALGSLP